MRTRQAAATESVGDVMSQSAFTIRADETLAAARTALETLGVHHLLVENRGRIVGIVSDRDVLRNLSPYADGISAQSRDDATLRRPVYSIATYDLQTVELDTPLEEAAMLMLAREISCLPVRGYHGNVVGVITKSDLLHAFAFGLLRERTAA